MLQCLAATSICSHSVIVIDLGPAARELGKLWRLVRAQPGLITGVGPGTGTVDRGHMSLIDHPSSVLSFDLTSPAALGVEWAKSTTDFFFSVSEDTRNGASRLQDLV